MKVKNLSIFGENREIRWSKIALTKSQSSFHTLALLIIF